MYGCSCISLAQGGVFNSRPPTIVTTSCPLGTRCRVSAVGTDTILAATKSSSVSSAPQVSQLLPIFVSVPSSALGLALSAPLFAVFSAPHSGRTYTSLPASIRSNRAHAAPQRSSGASRGLSRLRKSSPQVPPPTSRRPPSRPHRRSLVSAAARNSGAAVECAKPLHPAARAPCSTYPLISRTPTPSTPRALSCRVGRRSAALLLCFRIP